jgi:hypothetical protein
MSVLTAPLVASLSVLPTALVAAHVFGALDYASHCRLARVDRRHCAIAQLAQASPIELPVTDAMPASVWQRPGLRPRRITLDYDRMDDPDVGDPHRVASLAEVCARVDTLDLPDARDPLLLACATRLTTLRLHYVWDDQWRHLVTTCGALTDLDVVRAAPLSIDLVQHPPPKSLLALRFGMTSLMSKELRALSVACPRLALLEFNCPRFAECAGALEFPHLTRLEILCEWSDYGAPTNPAPWRLTTASFPRLARLQLAGNGVDAHRALSPLTALEVLDARHSRSDRAKEDTDETTGVFTVAAGAETPKSLPPAPAVCWPRLKSLAICTVDDIRGIRFPFATLTELYVSPWRVDTSDMRRSCGYGDLKVAVGTLLRKLPTLRHLTLSRYGVRSSSIFMSRDQTPIPAHIDARFTAGWNAVLDPVLTATSSGVATTAATTAGEAALRATRSGLQTLAIHCMAAVPDERGTLFRVHVPTLAAFLRAFASRSADASAAAAAAAARGAASLTETVGEEEKFCGVSEGEDDGNELLAPFAPCIRLVDECAF